MQNEEKKEADIYIFGDIVDEIAKEFWGVDADVSGYSLVQEVKELDVNTINVHINSYGGLVSEGFAIYNTLREHKAKIRTIVEGFACSAASVVFMAGEERIMRELSALFIHGVQSGVYGSAEEKRKAADSDEALTKTSAQAYLAHVTISEEELMEMLRKETWIQPQQAAEMRFATSVGTATATEKATQNAKRAIMQKMFGHLEEKKIDTQNQQKQEKPNEPKTQKKFFNLGRV